jgi:hypothetical protein
MSHDASITSLNQASVREAEHADIGKNLAGATVKQDKVREVCIKEGFVSMARVSPIVLVGCIPTDPHYCAMASCSMTPRQSSAYASQPGGTETPARGRMEVCLLRLALSA